MTTEFFLDYNGVHVVHIFRLLKATNSLPFEVSILHNTHEIFEYKH